MVNIKILKHCENLLKVCYELKQYVKIRLLNLTNDIEQIFPMGTAINHKNHNPIGLVFSTLMQTNVL